MKEQLIVPPCHIICSTILSIMRCLFFYILLLFASPVFGQSVLADHWKFGYSEIRKGMFSPRTVGDIVSMADGEHFTIWQPGRIMKGSYRTGELVGAIFENQEIGLMDYAFSADEKRILLETETTPIYRYSYIAEYYVYTIASQKLRKLSAGGPQQEAAFSPDGTKVAFVRDNDLFVADLVSGEEKRITSDGERNRIINGIPDWVYEEEFGFSRAFAWSPDSRRIAWMRFDESDVMEYGMNIFRHQLYPTDHTFKYPKAGEANSVVEVRCYDFENGRTVKMDIGPEPDKYIPRILWAPNGELAVYRLNRPQNHFEVLLFPPAGGTARTIYDERNDRYIDRVDDGIITFLPDGDRFIARSEKDGYTHLYLYSIKNGFLNRITSGEWEVTELVAVEGNDAYYISTETSPFKRDLFRIGLNGEGKKMLTFGDGAYSISPSARFKYYVSNFSSASTPNIVAVHSADGKLIRILEDNSHIKAFAEEVKLPEKEFFTFTTPQGARLNGYMLKPADFDPSREYPVFMTQYSGPGSQSVADSWGVDWEIVLTQAGYIVACVDGRGTGFRGEEFKKITYKQLGKYETEDQIEAARWLGSQSYVDASRIGIYGWSFGGFMALNCILKGNDVFKLAVAVAPVTSWRYYDTIYTELYNGDPRENPRGYDENSPLDFAHMLKGKLLIVHGTADDNVHIQNTYEMVDALTGYGKQFDMLIYPDRNHSLGTSRNHLIESVIRFVCEKL